MTEVATPDLAPSGGDGAPLAVDDVQPPVERWLVVLVVAAVVGVLVWLVVRLATSDWLPIGDYRTLQLRVSDVGGGDTPLLGVYSRYQWNHPGPMIFYILAGPYRLLGSSDVGLLVGALLVNLAAIATALWVGARAGRRALVLTGLFLVLLCIGMNPAGLADPWNPRFIVLAVFVVALSGWRTVAGDRVAAVSLALWGSFAVQCHLGSALPVLTVVAIGLAALVVRSVRGTRRARSLRTLLLASAVGLVCWIPPLVQQFTGDDGNMSRILDFMGDPPAATTGGVTGLRILMRFLSIPGDWVRGAEPTMVTSAFDPRGWGVPWALIALVVAAWWAWRRRWWSELTACAVAGALIVVAGLAASRIVGAPAPYLLRWMWPIAAFTWMAAAMVALRQLALTRIGARHGANLVVGLTLLGLLVMVPRGIDLTPLRLSDSWERTIRAVVPSTLDAIADVDGPVWVSDGVGVDGSASLELIARAERAGLDVRRSPSWGYIIGDQRTIDRLDAERELVFLTGDSHIPFDTNPDYRLVASYDPRTPEQRAALDAIVARHSDADVTGMSDQEARDARNAAFSAWAVEELQTDHPDADLVEYFRLLQNGDLLSVYITTGRPH